MYIYIYIIIFVYVGILEKLDVTRMRLMLGRCVYAYTVDLQNKCLAELILLRSFNSLMNDLFVETIEGWNVFTCGM